MLPCLPSALVRRSNACTATLERPSDTNDSAVPWKLFLSLTSHFPYLGCGHYHKLSPLLRTPTTTSAPGMGNSLSGTLKIGSPNWR